MPLQTNFHRNNTQQEEYVESSIKVIFGGMQPMFLVGKVTWAEMKYGEKGEQIMKFGINAGSGVGVRDDGKTVYPYSTHWFTVISNQASQTAKSKDTQGEDARGTNAEQMSELAVPGTSMSIVYFPQVNVDGTPRLTIQTKKEGTQEVEYAMTSWGTYGGSAILAVSPLGTKDERIKQAADYEEARAKRQNGQGGNQGTNQGGNQGTQQPAVDTGKNRPWRAAGQPATQEPAKEPTPPAEPLAPVQTNSSTPPVPPLGTKKPVWGKSS